MTKTKIIVVEPVLVILLLLLVILIGSSSPNWISGLIINGLIGVIILAIINALFKSIEVPINIWTVLIAALGGILGVALLVLLNLAGVKEL
ncbi:MAG: pro-sigmaK processing inhibitor BofA family protein [archaeon]|jgi:pro-sigmaK processing inhibitor BofA